MSASVFVSAPPTRAEGARTVWLVAGLVLAAIAIGAWFSSIVSEQFQSGYLRLPVVSRDISASFSVVRVSADAGNLTIEQAGAGSPSVVRSSGTRGTTAPTNQVVVRNGTLYINSTCPGPNGDNCSRNYVLQVPSSTVVYATAQGNVSLSDLSGSARLRSQFGNVRVVGGAGAVRVDAYNGNVSVSGPHSRLTLRSPFGNVRFSGATGPVQAMSQEGEVSGRDLRSAQVSGISRNGDVNLSFATVPVNVEVSTGGSNAVVTVPRGPTRYAVQAHSRHGRVVDTLARSKTSKHRIRVSSNYGDVRLGTR